MNYNTVTDSIRRNILPGSFTFRSIHPLKGGIVDKKDFAYIIQCYVYVFVHFYDLESQMAIVDFSSQGGDLNFDLIS